jgi:CRISPR-associated protein Cas6
MSDAAERGDAPVVDVVFALAGTSLPAEHAVELWQATVSRLPWIAGERRAGVFPLRTSVAPGGEALLARRAKLVLRIPRERVAEARALAGQSLDVAGRRLDVGAGELRPIRAWGTLHAQRVTLGEADDARFETALAAALEALEVDCEFITGRRRTQRVGTEEVVGFSVALVGLRPEASLAVQCEGIGGERRLGWGIFVPHKSIAAVV